MANAWGVTTLQKFSSLFEKEKVTGFTSTTLMGGGSSLAKTDWAKTPGGEKAQFQWPAGSESKPVALTFGHEGTGRPWVHFETVSAIPLKKPLELGYSVVRKVTPVEAKVAGKWSKGDVANVELIVTARADQAWVVVRDPVPAGASHLGAGLDGSSQLLDRAKRQRPKAGEIEEFPSEFEEKSLSHFVSYAAYLPKGTYKMSYRIRLNASGTMKLPPTHVEAMYSPETFGDSPNADWLVAE